MEQNEKKTVPHLKVWGDWLVKFQKLDDAEFGRFIRGAIGYVCAGEVPSFSGFKEGFAFDMIKPALDTEMKNYLEKVRKNTENGAKGAAVRWGTDGERHTENGERYLTDGENSQEEEKEEDQREKKEEKREITEEKGVIGEEDENFSRNDANNSATDAELLQAAWRKYNKMREEKGKPVTDKDLTAIKANLEKYSDGDISRAAVLLENAADKGWMNVFPDDEAKGKSRQVKRTVKNLARGMAL